MQPRSRIRGRDPPSGGGGGRGGGGGGGRGRYRRRSTPPPSPRHHRRPRDTPQPPPQPQRRSPDRHLTPRRYEDNPNPLPEAADRRSRADVLLEAGRLAAHYLVATGVLPEHLLRAREELNHNPAPRTESLPPVSYARKREQQQEDDPRPCRNGGDWARGKGDDDRQPRRSGWDRRSHSFDSRRKCNDGGGDVDRGARRNRDYDDPKKPPMSRSYSQNDRRASGDGRVDRRRRSRSRSRSRSRTRTRSYYGDSRRDSDCRAGTRDLDHTKPPDSVVIPPPAAAVDGDVSYGDVDEMPRQPRVPSSVVVAELIDGAGQAMAIKDGEMESEIVGLDHAQDISEDEDGEFAEDVSEDEDGQFAVADLNLEDGGQWDVTQPQASDVDVHPAESVEEPVHMQSQLSNVEGDIGTARINACMIEPLGDNNGASPQVREQIEVPRSEVGTVVGDINRDEQELPAWFRIFDLNVVETPEGCEMTEISGDPPTDHAYDSVPDLVNQIHPRTNYDASESQGQDEQERDNCLMEDGHDLCKYGQNNADEPAQDNSSKTPSQDERAWNNHPLEDEHDLNNYDLNSEADEHSQDNHLLSNKEMLLNADLDSCHLSNEHILPKQNVNEQEHAIYEMKNGQILVSQDTANEDLESYHVIDEQLMRSSHGVDEYPDEDHQMKPEPMLLPKDVHDLDSYDLSNEQMLLNNGVEKYAADVFQSKDEQMLLDQSVIGQSRIHDMDSRQTIPVIDLEDDYKEQPDTTEFVESKSDIIPEHMDNVLQERMSFQDHHASSFLDNPQTNTEAASCSYGTPNFGNRCTGRGAVNAQVIPNDDDVLYGAFDKLPLEVINVWDAPSYSSEVGKSL